MHCPCSFTYEMNESERERKKEKKNPLVSESYRHAHIHTFHCIRQRQRQMCVCALYPWKAVPSSPRASPSETEHACVMCLSMLKKCPAVSSYESNSLCNCSLLPSVVPVCLLSLVHADTLAEPFSVLQKHDVIAVMQLFCI